MTGSSSVQEHLLDACYDVSWYTIECSWWVFQKAVVQYTPAPLLRGEEEEKEDEEEEDGEEEEE